MDSEFWGQIAAAVVGAVITLGIGGIVYYIRGRRGNWIVVKRISETPQITFTDKAREKLDIRYLGNPVNNLVLNNLQIFNAGDENTNEAVEIRIEVIPKDGEIEFLQVEVNDPLEKIQYQSTDDTIILSNTFAN